MASQTCDEDNDLCVTNCSVERDADGDGHDAIACGGDDCDDADALRYPGNVEVCDATSHDEDCDPTTFGDTDADGDGAIDHMCCNVDAAGGMNCGTDCDDSTLARRPGQLEICDSIDNDCDGMVDEEMNDVPWYTDGDSDGFGEMGGDAVTSCTPITGRSLLANDCDDTSASVNVVAAETCDGVDNNCDGTVDEGCGMDGGSCAPGSICLDSGTDSGSASASCPSGSLIPDPGGFMGACCYRTSNATRPGTPQFRMAALRLSEPATLASSIVAGALNQAMDEERFNWLLSVSGAATDGGVALTTGFGLRNVDSTFSFGSGMAPGPGDPNRWNPQMFTGALAGETISAPAVAAGFTVATLDSAGGVALELPVNAFEIVSMAMSVSRSCVGTRGARSYSTMDGSLKAFITIADAQASMVNLAPINTSLCNFIRGAAADTGDCMAVDPATWTTPPNARCTGGACTEVCTPGSDLTDSATCNAWKLVGGFGAHGVSIVDVGGCGVCTAPAHAAATCLAGSCGFACNSGYTEAGTGCVRAACTSVGIACDPARGCTVGGCIAEQLSGVGSATDPVTGLPGGGTSVPITAWPGGYCSPNINSAGGVDVACDISNPADPACGGCGTCVDLGIGVCLADCAPSITDNSVCRDGYDCNLTVDACVPGCGSDEECRVIRQESNGIAGIQAPNDCTGDSARPAASQVCGGVDSNFDHLVYDATSSSVCDMATYRCTNPGTAGAEAGIPCTQNDQCEAEGRCIDEASVAWPGGYCTKYGCNLAGNGCAGAGVCQSRRIGVAICLESCTVAAGATAGNQAAWLTNTGGCRVGYACEWNGVGATGSPNGGCAPGNFNAVTTNNVASACTNDTDCWSPFGQGFCLQPEADGSGFRGGYCTVFDCLAPGTPSNVCGAGGTCVDLDGSAGDLTGCMHDCTSATDCRPLYACVDVDGDPGTLGSVCTPGCTVDSECRTTERCTIPAGTSVGACVLR